MIALAYYLLKVIICSGILFLYYHLALRNKLFHQWNRFYLLVAVLISLVAPIIQVSVLHHTTDQTNNAIRLLQAISSADGYMDEITITAHRSMPTEQWFMIGYIMISILFLVSLLLSLAKIYSIIKSHSCKWIENIRFINTTVQGTPFSFFRFIFWNEKIDLSTETGQQIFEHELVHVKEKHSADKLFIQLLLIVFWCNPFFWLIRRELKLIHEFIADKKAVGEHGTAALAAMILNSSYPTQFNSLTNQFFQTSIKRRLAMLSKIHNPRINYISRLLALPIVAATVLAFTLKTKTVHTSVAKLEKTITVIIDAGHGLENGNYNGARDGNVYEDQIVLSIANKIKSLNNDNKLKIVLTRASDNIVDLQKRVEIAKENNADLFISLHINAAPEQYKDSAGMNGMEVMVSNKNTPYQQESEILGSVLQQQLSSVYFVKPSLIKKQVGVWVLDHNVCPSVLIECGFLTDEKDRNFITQDQNQNAIAEKILQGIERYAANEQQMQRSEADTVPKNRQVQVTTKGQDKTEKVKSFSVKYDSQKTTPLYIVDGKEYNGSLDDINPNDIESISVLKDDAAIKKYGKKGQNGVIELTLKKTRTPQITKSDEVVTTVNSSANDTIPKKEPVFSKVEVEASVDRTEWQQFLSKNLQSAIESAAKKGMKSGTYTVNVKFLVKKDGSVSNVQAVNDVGYGLSEASVAAVTTGPKWKPGMQNGKVVNSYHTQPITFVIQDQ